MSEAPKCVPDSLQDEMRDVLRRHAQAEPCDWAENDDGYYDTGCGQAFVMTDGGTPAEHRFRFCCYCGKPIDEVPYVEEEDRR